MEHNNWCLIESDPGVFTCLIEGFGVNNVEFEELFSVEETSLAALFSPLPYQRKLPIAISKRNTNDDHSSWKDNMDDDVQNKVYGLVFLFKVASKGENDQGDSSAKNSNEQDYRYIDYLSAPGLFFAQQTVSNACATQAIISILLNSEYINENQIGAELRQLKEFASDFDPRTKGFTLGNSDVLREAHNSFRLNTSLLEEDDSRYTDDKNREPAFHFVAYTVYKGVCYELDGLSPGPRLIGDVSDSLSCRWTDVVAPAIQKRIQSLQGATSEIRFNLLACVEDRRAIIHREMVKWSTFQLDTATKLLSLPDVDPSLVQPSIDELYKEQEQGRELNEGAYLEDLPDDKNELFSMLNTASQARKELKTAEQREMAKRQQWERENELRRFSFVPLVFAILRGMAKKGELHKSYLEILKTSTKCL